MLFSSPYACASSLQTSGALLYILLLDSKTTFYDFGARVLVKRVCSDGYKRGSQEFDAFFCGQFIAQFVDLGAVSFDDYGF